MSKTESGGAIVQVIEQIGSENVVLGSMAINSLGTHRINFTPTGSAVQLWILGPYDMILKPTCYTYPVTTQETYLVDICDENKDRYRFGFNGQEKVNELAGIGNHNTALFWEYDTRTGRRWNVDPVDQINISNYAVNRLNPVGYNDPNGDVVPVVIAGYYIVEGVMVAYAAWASYKILDNYAKTTAATSSTYYYHASQAAQSSSAGTTTVKPSTQFDQIYSNYTAHKYTNHTATTTTKKHTQSKATSVAHTAALTEIVKPVLKMASLENEEPLSQEINLSSERSKSGARTELIDLQEQLTLEEAMNGEGEPFMTGYRENGEPVLGDPKYNPETGTHDKMKHNHDHGDGTSTEVHYDRSRTTGETSGYKIKDDTNLKSRGNLPQSQ